jgi:hypothetical protein
MVTLHDDGEPRQDDAPVHLDDLCQHVGKGIEEVDERGELGVCGQESEDVLVPQMLPQSLKKVEVARSTLRKRNTTFG